MFSYLRLGVLAALLVAVAGCGPDYSPNTYSTAAVQQANKVDQGVVAGYREVAIRADGTVGAVTGGAAGGVLGAQTPDGGVITALSTIGGTLIGGLVGTSVEHAAGDTKAFEYIVRKTGGDLISVTQKDEAPLAVGLKVLVIEGKQARIVPDYSVPPEPPAPAASSAKNGVIDRSNNERSVRLKEPDEADRAVTATGAPNAAPNDTAGAPQPAPGEAGPTPGSAAEGGSATQSPAPQAAATPAPQTAAPSPPTSQPPAAATDSQPAPGDQGGAAPAAAPVPTPAPADGNPMP